MTDAIAISVSKRQSEEKTPEPNARRVLVLLGRIRRMTPAVAMGPGNRSKAESGGCVSRSGHECADPSRRESRRSPSPIGAVLAPRPLPLSLWNILPRIRHSERAKETDIHDGRKDSFSTVRVVCVRTDLRVTVFPGRRAPAHLQSSLGSPQCTIRPSLIDSLSVHAQRKEYLRG